MLDFEAQQEAIKNRMRQYSGQQYEAPQGQMIGGNFIAPNAFQHIAAALRGYGGIKGTAMAEQELKDLSAKRQTSMTDALRGYTTNMMGTPASEATKEMFVADDAGGGEMTMGTQVTPAVAPNPMAANMALMNAPDPQLQRMGMTGVTQFQQAEAERQRKLADAQAAEAKVQAQKDQQLNLWQQSEGNPQTFLAAGGDFDFAQNMVSGQNMGKSKVARTITTVDPKTGREVNVMIDEFGNRIGDSMPVYTPPKAAPAPKPIQTIDTPQGKMILNADGTVRPITTSDGKPITAAPTTEEAKRNKDANDALATIDQAAKLIDIATGSYGGALIDQGFRVFGSATEGSKAAAQLKALEGDLIFKMPKMSGPQSDRDVALYKQMAANIGDPTVPAEEKKAALATLKEIQQRYAGIAPPSATPPVRPGPTPQNLPQTGRIRFDAQGNIIK
jgi:hypothetical protein